MEDFEKCGAYPLCMAYKCDCAETHAMCETMKRIIARKKEVEIQEAEAEKKARQELTKADTEEMLTLKRSKVYALYVDWVWFRYGENYKNAPTWEEWLKQ